MNRVITCLLLCFSTSLFAENKVELRVAAFMPQKQLFRDIYGDVLPNYQLEISRTLCSPWEAFANIGFLYKKGHVHGCGSSKIWVVDITLGPKYNFCISRCLDFYLGAGICLGGAHVNNKFCCSNKETAFILGGKIKTGFNFFLENNLYFDLFLDYFYEEAFFSNRVNIGGLNAGLGMGWPF